MEVECPYCSELILMPDLPAESETSESAPSPGDSSHRNRSRSKKSRNREAQMSLHLAESQQEAPPKESPPPSEPESSGGPEPSSESANSSKAAAPAEDSAPVESKASALPARRERSREDEMRRLAAMAGNVEYDLDKFEKKGMIAFACPMCHRPIWVAKKDSGSVLTCEGCSLEIVAPAPELGLPARLVDAAADALAQRPATKTVLPASRKVSDQTLAEGTPAGRTKRGHPSADSQPQPTHEEPPGETRKSIPKTPSIEPIPARADTVLAATGTQPSLPTERKSQARVVGAEKAKREPQAGAPVTPAAPTAKSAKPQPRKEPTESTGEVDSGEERPKLLRLNDDKRSFLPKLNQDADADTDNSWGQAEQQQPVSRRFAIVGWLVLIPVLLVLGIWTMRAVFKKKEDPAPTDRTAAENQARTVHVARDILTKFFEAKSFEEMSRYVRHPEITLPRMTAFYKKAPAKMRVTDFADTKEGALDGVDFLTGIVALEGEKSRPVALEIPPPDSANRDDLRIDWESFVFWSPTPWDDFLQQEIDKPSEFRVVLQRDDYLNRPFDDAGKWLCFKIYHPDSFGRDYGYCYGYCALDSAVATALVQPMRSAAEKGEAAINCMLTIRFVPESRGRKNFVPQVLIDKFRPGWLIVDKE